MHFNDPSLELSRRIVPELTMMHLSTQERADSIINAPVPRVPFGSPTTYVVHSRERDHKVFIGVCIEDVEV